MSIDSLLARGADREAVNGESEPAVEAVAPDVELVHLDAHKWMIRRSEPQSGTGTLIGFIHTHHGMHEALCVGAQPAHLYASTFDRALQLVLDHPATAARAS